MNVLLLSTYDTAGGAAIAAHRLAEALNNNGVKARMMALFRKGDAPYVIPVGSERIARRHKLWERGVMFAAHGLKRRGLFETSIANTGCDITQTRLFREADIVHLHWTCHGMLSLKDIGNILSSGKPVVWTLHDMWPLTAICHYTRGCEQFTAACRRCPQEDCIHPLYRFAQRRWKMKKRIYDGAPPVSFVACSEWLAGQARQSALTKGHRVMSIPNTINTHLFRKQDKGLARRRLDLPLNKRLLLFVAQSVGDPRKGMQHLQQALQRLIALQPTLADTAEMVILGGKADEVSGLLPLKAHCLGYLDRTSDIVDAYNAADVFVIPSTEDNLPNTIMEAMACGVPCVGFDIGGIPEMIDHRKNGYIARTQPQSQPVTVDTDDMAEGLRWLLCDADRTQLSTAAVEKVHTTYAHQHIAARYIRLYQQLVVEQ